MMAEHSVQLPDRFERPGMEPPFYVCPGCASRFDEPGECPRCPDEPLLDIRDKQVRFLLRDIDTRRRDKRETIAHWSAVPIGMVLGVLLLVVTPSELYAILPGPRGVYYVGAFIMPAAGAFFLLARLLRPAPRFAWLGDESTEV